MRTLEQRGRGLVFSRFRTKFFLSTCILLGLLMVPFASADLVTINSSWTDTVPTIDGDVFSFSGEWSDATVVDFTLDMRLRGVDISIETLNARLYVKNDGNNIYAAVQIFNEDYDAEDLGNHYDAFALLFEDNHDHVLVDGDNGAGIEMFPGSAFYANNDLYFNSSSTQWLADAATPPSGASKTNDGAFAWTHSNPIEEATGTYTFEMRIPLVGSDGDAYDLAITSCGTTLGFTVWFHEKDEGMDGVYPDDPATWPNYLETEDGTKFGNLVLACPPPPPPTVGGRAAPIVVPTNNANLSTTLIWLVSLIMFTIALAVVFVKLKQKKL